MNKIIFTSILVFSSYAMADDCKEVSSSFSEKEKLLINTDVPKDLEGATYTINKKDGSKEEVPAKDYKLVKRKQQFIVTKVETSTVRQCNKPNANRVSVLGGYGAKNGLSVTKSGNVTTVESHSGAVGGLQLQHMITDRISIGGQIQSNGSGLGSVGYDW